MDKKNVFLLSPSFFYSHTNQNTFIIYIDDVKISQVDSTVYLGSFIDSKLNWREHVFYVKKKKSPKVGFIRKLKH